MQLIVLPLSAAFDRNSCWASLKSKRYAARGLQVTSEAFVGFGERTSQPRALMSMPNFRDSSECCIQCKATGNVRAGSTHGAACTSYCSMPSCILSRGLIVQCGDTRAVHVLVILRVCNRL